ncbi:MAG: autotransporter-associated beta strand repeat-containing protein, partial [Chthoniobacterales bacterium]
MKKSSYTKLAIAVTAALSFGPSAQAAPATWNASPTIGNWEAAGAEDNWSTGPGTFPGALSSITDSDTATFLTSSGTTIAINATASNATSLGIGSITFGVVASASAFTIGTTGGNSLLLGNGGQIGISSGRTVTGATETVNAPLVLEPASATTAGAYTFSNASGLAGDILKIGGTVTGGTTTQGITLTLTGSSTTANEISGIISNGGAALGVAVTKASSGTWSLSGTNSYTGVTTIAGGVLLANSANALNTTALGGNVTFTGGTLRYGSTFAGGANADISSRIKNSTSAISIDTNGFNATFASALDSSNTGGLTKSGTGTLTLSVANSYTGNTTISNNGTLAAGNDAAFGTGTVVFLGGSPNASTVASSANVTLANNFTASGAFATFNASGGTMTINGNFTGTQQVNLTPTNKITFAGTNSLVSGFGGQGLNIGAGAGGVDFTGSTTVSGASTAAGAGYLLISGTAVSVKTGGTLTINGTTNASKAS